MENFNDSIQSLIEGAGWLAPVLFVLLHLIRPFLFLPVIVVCIAGGVFFGFVEGAVLSFIGLSLMCLAFYKLVDLFPNFRERVSRLKSKVFHDRTVTVGQVMLLRIMPFVHFHLLSLYLMEMTKSYKEYTYYSMLGVLFPAVIYTAFGNIFTQTPLYVSVFLMVLLVALYAAVGKIHDVRVNDSKN